MTQHPPKVTESIDLARFALVMAHLRRAPPGAKAEVLARLGLDERAWEGAVAAWDAERDAELARGANELTHRFGVAFGRALSQLEKGGPTPEPASAPVEPVAPPLMPPVAPVPMGPPSVGGAPPAASISSTPPPVPVPFPAFVPPASDPPRRRPAATLQMSAVPEARLPFAPGNASGQSFQAAVAHARAVQGPTPAVIRLGETAGLPDARPAFGDTAALPGGVADAPRLPPGVPNLTLPQYASLRVDLQTRPAEAEAILVRYGVARDGRPALDAYWRSRFEADPLLRMMFAKAYATYIAWLRENGGGRAE